MAKKRRQVRIPTPAWERPRGAIGSRVLGRSFQFYGMLVIAAVLLVALGIVAFAFGAEELEKARRPGSTAVQVEDTRFRLDYFASRLETYVLENGGAGVVQPTGALTATADLLIREEIVRRFAGEFDVAATEDEIKQATADRLGITVDDESFDVVFEQELARIGMSESDHRGMVEAAVLEEKLRERFLTEVPESAESVHYRQIIVNEQERADELVSELEAGEDFVALAAEDFNLDVANRENGGDVAWVPSGVLDASTEELVFALDIGEITTIPLPQGVIIIEMLEKEDDRAVEDDQKAVLAARALEDWVTEKRGSLEEAGAIVNNMDPAGDFDEDKAEWAVERAYQS